MSLLQLLHLLTFLPLACCLVCMLEVSRVLRVREHPIKAVAYYTVAIGAGACLLWQIPVTVPGALAMLIQDTGVAMLCAVEVRTILRANRIRYIYSYPAHRKHSHGHR